MSGIASLSWITEAQPKLQETVPAGEEAALIASYACSCAEIDGKSFSSADERHGNHPCGTVREKPAKVDCCQPNSDTNEAVPKVRQEIQTKPDERDTQLWSVSHKVDGAGLSSPRGSNTIQTDCKGRSFMDEEQIIDAYNRVNVGEESQQELWETVHSAPDVGLISSPLWSSVQTNYHSHSSMNEKNRAEAIFCFSACEGSQQKLKFLSSIQANSQAKVIQQNFGEGTGVQPKPDEKETQQELREVVHSVESAKSQWCSLVRNHKDGSSKLYTEATSRVNIGEGAQHIVRNATVNQKKCRFNFNQPKCKEASESVDSAKDVGISSVMRGSSVAANYKDCSSIDGKNNDEAGYRVHVGTASAWKKVEFLEVCHLCKRHLARDLDIFMYRGDQAFCSVKCRQKQIFMDQKFSRTRWKVAASKKDSVGQSSSIPPTANL